MQEQQLLRLILAKQNQQLQEIKKQLSQFSKYFYNPRQNITLLYDKNIVFIIHKQYLKLVDLGKIYTITDLTYNYQRNILAFYTAEGHLYLHFVQSKTQILLKKDYKRIMLMDWIYQAPLAAHFVVAEEAGIHLYKLDDEKKSIREVKHISGKYHCFLYEPLGQFMIAFVQGDCKTALTYHFEQQKIKNWFKCGEITVKIADDEILNERIRKRKSFGLEGSHINKEIFPKKVQSQEYELDVLRINGTPYMIFYSPTEGKLELTPMLDFHEKKQVTIKLPSDCRPTFNIVDNMFVVHLKSQRITFIYDINFSNYQALVSPYPLSHENAQLQKMVYSGAFLGKRVLFPNGFISKWIINLPVIYLYLKANEMLIFEFLLKRKNSKMQMIKWMRQNLFTFKLINLSKMWKAVFRKVESGQYDESQTVTIIELYSNLFYTLSLQPLVPQQQLANILLECLRQALEIKINIPEQLFILATQVLLNTKKYDLLAYLCHHEVIRADQRVVDLIQKEAQIKNQELLVNLAIDMACQIQHPKDILKMIMKSQRVRQAKRYVKIFYQKIEVLDIMEVAKYLTHLQDKKAYIEFAKTFILQKYPAMNLTYLDEAEHKLF